jgi:hypothetical protein
MHIKVSKSMGITIQVMYRLRHDKKYPSNAWKGPGWCPSQECRPDR